MRARTKLLGVVVAGLCLLAIWPIANAAAKQSVAVGRGGAVVSDTTQATNAGLRVLRRGGTAADAAVAVASTLGVTDPFVAGVGGGGYFVYYDAHTHRVYTIDGRETTPAAADQNLFIDPATGKPLAFPTAVTSGLSVGVPGTLMTWQRALDRFGRFSLARDLKPAEHVAKRGFKVTDTLREEDRENAFRFDQFSSTASMFLPGGQLPDVGSIMRNPDLAQTYRQIGRQGVGALYGGPIGADSSRGPQPAAGARRDAGSAPRQAGAERPRPLHRAVRRPDTRRLPGLRRVLDGAVVKRWFDRRGVAEHPRQLQPVA